MPANKFDLSLCFKRALWPQLVKVARWPIWTRWFREWSRSARLWHSAFVPLSYITFSLERWQSVDETSNGVVTPALSLSLRVKLTVKKNKKKTEKKPKKQWQLLTRQLQFFSLSVLIIQAYPQGNILNIICSKPWILTLYVYVSKLHFHWQPVI